MKIKQRWSLWAAAALLVFSGAVSLAALNRWSLTFDEITYAPAGYDYLRTGRVRFNKEKGPLAKALSAAPLLLLAPIAPVPTAEERGYGTGWNFFFRNEVPASKLAWWCRLASIPAGLVLAALLFAWAREDYGPEAALLSLAFLLADPFFRSLSRLAISDIFSALFFFAALWSLKKSLSGKNGVRALALSGVLAGAGVLCKSSGVLLFPAAGVLLGVYKSRWKALRALIILAAAAAVPILLFYHVDIGVFIDGFLQQSHMMNLGASKSFFLGEISADGWLYYYILAFLIKTPWPFIVACAAGAVLWTRRRDRRGLLWIAVPSGLVFLAASAAKFYAARYLFPAFPLMMLLPAAAWKYGARRMRIALAVLLLCQLAEAAATFPHSLSYMNYPWRAAGHRYLANSDFDWGQDLPALYEFWEEEGRPPLTLCYFGTAEPAAYGIEAQELATVAGIPHSSRVLPAAPMKEYLAVGAGCRQYMVLGGREGGSTRAWGWLDERKPLRIVGKTFFIYETSRDVEAHGRIGQLHFYQGDFHKAYREMRRVLELDPANKTGKDFLERIKQHLP